MLSPGDFLKEYVQAKAVKNPQFSMRSLARLIGVSAPFLSRVVSGKSKLSISRAQDIALKIKLTRAEKAMFLRAVAVYSTRGAAREILMDALDEFPQFSPFALYPKISPQNASSLLREWYIPAILDLVTCSNFKADPVWIASRLKITKAETIDALDTLERLGLLDRSTPRWRKVEDSIYTASDEPLDVTRHYHGKMTYKALELLNRAPTRAEYEQRSMTSMNMAIDPAKLPQAKKMIEKFQDRLADALTTGDCREVYYLNVQLFPLTQV